MIEPTNQKNWLSFGVDPVPHTDFGHFPTFSTSLTITAWGILRDLLAFLIFTGRLSRHSAK